MLDRQPCLPISTLNLARPIAVLRDKREDEEDFQDAIL
jgi:hypothetical protein